MPATEPHMTAAPRTAAPAKESLLLNLACNVILPGLVL
ncbi:MAG: hypothetical protein RIS56_984, partial [Verrucomicrobiota bacterium]